MKPLWTDEEQRLAERAARRDPSPEWGIGDDVRALYLCSHQFRMHGETGRCWATVWLPRGDGTPDLEDPRYCGCDLFERAEVKR